jgi:hypothetical protein
MNENLKDAYNILKSTIRNREEMEDYKAKLKLERDYNA